MNGAPPSLYGEADATYQAAGAIDGITKLVDLFYHFMDTLPAAKHIRDMHPKDLTLSRQKLTYFLSGWMGGPRLYAEHFGSISIPKIHMHLTIESEERDAWMHCMEKAINEIGYTDTLKAYLMEQLFKPAEMIRKTSQ